MHEGQRGQRDEERASKSDPNDGRLRALRGNHRRPGRAGQSVVDRNSRFADMLQPATRIPFEAPAQKIPDRGRRVRR
jgi:hypothetical protein